MAACPPGREGPSQRTTSRRRCWSHDGTAAASPGLVPWSGSPGQQAQLSGHLDCCCPNVILTRDQLRGDISILLYWESGLLCLKRPLLRVWQPLRIPRPATVHHRIHYLSPANGDRNRPSAQPKHLAQEGSGLPPSRADERRARASACRAALGLTPGAQHWQGVKDRCCPATLRARAAVGSPAGRTATQGGARNHLKDP